MPSGHPLVQAAVRGASKGLRTGWELAKVIAPAYLIVTILRRTPVLPWLAGLFSPLMGWFGLPGEAAVVLVVGNLVDFYSGLGAMASLDFTPKELTTLAVMLGISHNLIVETAVTRRLGVSFWGVIAYRIVLAILAGALLSRVWGWFFP